MTLIAAVGLGLGQSQAQAPANKQGGHILSQSWKVGKGEFLHFTGLVRDVKTKEGLDRASIVLMVGEEFLAGTYADHEGKFFLQVPTKEVSAKSFTLKIRYLNHIFVREHITASSQDLTIDLNSAIWMQEVEIETEHVFEKDSPVLGRLVTGRIHPGQIPFYDTIEEWIWMRNSEVYRDEF